MDGSGHATSFVFVYNGSLPDWKVVGAADYENDGNTDILLQHTTGAVGIWYMDGSGHATSFAFIYSGSLPAWTAIGGK